MGGLGVSLLKKLQTNQNNIVRICLNRRILDGSTNKNYNDLSVLPIKKVALLFVVNLFIKGNCSKSFVNKRESITYDIPIKYTKKSFGQSFVDYLGPTYFNSMNIQCKKNPRYAKYLMLKRFYINVYF